MSFGSALGVVPLLESRLVLPGHWLTAHNLLVAVATRMITPGPVVVVATFAGYLGAGVRSSAPSPCSCRPS